jgi:hypothetical protein
MVAMPPPFNASHSCSFENRISPSLITCLVGVLENMLFSLVEASR